MTKLVGTILFIPFCLLAGSKHSWKTGKLLDSQSAKTYIQTGASTESAASGTAFTNGTVTDSGFGNASYSGATMATATGNTETQIHSMAIQSTQLMIIGDEYIYVVEDNVEKAVGPALRGSLARAIANRKHGCRYVVGDPIDYAQEKSHLYVRDDDGKECKLDIVRQARLQTGR